MTQKQRGSTTSKRSPRALARSRGRAFEQRMAETFPDGYVYTGQAGDVVAGDWIFECKYRKDFRLKRLVELADWIAQAKRNAEDWLKRGKPKRWAILFTGGRKTGSYAIVDLETFTEMTQALAEKESQTD